MRPLLPHITGRRPAIELPARLVGVEVVEVVQLGRHGGGVAEALPRPDLPRVDGQGPQLVAERTHLCAIKEGLLHG